MRNRIFSRFVILLVSSLFFSGIALSQERTITGTVYDGETNEAMPGTTVLIKGTTTGSTTDLDGNFQINVTDGQTIVVSFIGYLSEEMLVAGQTNLTVKLTPELTELSEIIVIGYGTQKKEDKTGAVFSVSEEDIQTVAVQDPIQGIQGKVAGVVIQKSGSDPNSGFNVKIRGASGLSSGTDPLYVVDGVVGVDPTTIAPEDISSFNVLKDASSAAIYGSRGANGVIIINTKKGEKGEMKVDFSTYVSFDQIAPRSRLDLMSADEFRAYGDEMGIDYRDLGNDTDWQDEIYRIGFSHNEIVSISGGSEKGTFRASVSNNSIEGLINNSAKDRLIMRINAQGKAINDRVNISMNMANTIEHNDYVNYGSSGADGTLYQAFQRNPTLPVYDDDGSYFQDPTPPVNNYSNPVAILNDVQNERDAKRFLGNVKLDIDIFSGLKLTLNGAYTRDDDEDFYFESSKNTVLNGDGLGHRSYDNEFSTLFESYASYTKAIEKHNFNMVGGYSYQKFGWDGFYAGGRDPGSDFTESNDLESMADVVPGDITSYKGESKLISGFGRLAYNYNSKYFVTGTIRRDGSSKFGANNEWGWFPSGSVAWNIKKESFLSGLGSLSAAKFRVGYGQTGNQEIDTYKDVALFGVTGYTVDPTTNEYTVNYGATQNPNPDLKWEVNTELNVGLDFGLLNNRITGSVDYFNKKTTDLIYEYTVPVPPNLVDNTLANAGAIDISGVEVVITGHILSGDNLKWSSTIVASHDKAIVKELGNDEYPAVDYVKEGYLQEPLGYGTWTQIMQEDEERGTFYGPKFAGIDANSGEFLYEKADGTFQTIDNISDDDKQILGNARPDIELGWSNSLTLFKKVNVNFTFRGMFGHDVLNGTAMVFDNPSYFLTGRNILNSAPDRSELTGSSDFSDYWLEKGNFVRLENITVGYTFATSEIDWLSHANVYFSANNLFTITKYEGIDPSPRVSDDSMLGIDLFNVYPKSTTLTVGCKLTF